MMASNPIMALVQMIKGGGNPQQLIGQMIQANPQIGQAMRLLEGKTQQQQMQVLRNMAQERGVDLGRLARQIGLPWHE